MTEWVCVAPGINYRQRAIIAPLKPGGASSSSPAGKEVVEGFPTSAATAHPRCGELMGLFLLLNYWLSTCEAVKGRTVNLTIKY